MERHRPTFKGKQTRQQLMTRRALLEDLIKAALVGAAGSALGGCVTLEEKLLPLVQSHFRDMDDAELAMVLQRIEDQVFAEFGQRPEVWTTSAAPGVRWVQTLDLSACLGCGQCQQACFEENNQNRDPAIYWIEMLRSHDQKIWLLHHTESYHRPPTETDDHKFYLPTGCQQCESPACVSACPVKATWKEPDGITVVDYNWCIGCRYCMAACPYGARRFNWAHVTLPDADLNPSMHYLGNRPRMYGVVEKCTFCIQRTRLGYEPACVTVCPVGARKFGDVNDPTTEVHYIVNRVRTIQLKHDLGTEPRFYYYFSAGLG
jgi:Fe-S-cluster-containing dehydrogenase component